MATYIFPVKAIRGILQKELELFKDGFFKSYPTFIMSDMQKEFVYIAYNTLKAKLDKCNTYDELEEYISFCGYRMNLQEWIDSLT